MVCLRGSSTATSVVLAVGDDRGISAIPDLKGVRPGNRGSRNVNPTLSEVEPRHCRCLTLRRHCARQRTSEMPPTLGNDQAAVTTWPLRPASSPPRPPLVAVWVPCIALVVLVLHQRRKLRLFWVAGADLVLSAARRAVVGGHATTLTPPCDTHEPCIVERDVTPCRSARFFIKNPPVQRWMST